VVSEKAVSEKPASGKRADGRRYLGMGFREFFRASRNFLLFPLILAGVVVGFTLAYELMGAASFRHPWTWILPIIGFVIFSAVIWFFYGNTSMENAKYLNDHKVFSGVDLGLHLPLNPERVNINRMARDCYGYGRWDAPYWFIGIGEGMGKNDSLEKRSAVWSRFKKDGLMDCRDFHLSIGETAWHRDKPRAKIQRTWGSLMLLLMTFLEKTSDDENRRDYQRKHWGAANGETCVIELFGLPAPTFEQYQKLARNLFTQELINEILEDRIKFIVGNIQAHKPKFVVMYGREARKQWNEIAGIPLRDDEVYTIGSTMMVSATHPNDRHIKERNRYWIGLGEALRNRAKDSTRRPL
jgi:hypothetical protein